MKSFQVFAETARLRLLALLAEHELTVTELVEILGLAQSRVSTHLGKLREAGLVRDRRVGTSSYYRLSEAIPELPAQLCGSSPATSTTPRSPPMPRARDALAARAADPRWPELVAGEMERHYSPGRTWEATCRAFAGLLQLGDVLDLGSGDGTMAELLAPRARTITCVDVSPRVAEAARRRLCAAEHVRCVCADMHALPLRDASFDQVLAFNALACAHDPAQALREAARVLRPGGQLAIVTLDAHEQMAAVAGYGHVQPGFAPSALSALLLQAGLRVSHCAVSSRERRSPRFGVVTAFAEKPKQPDAPGARPPSTPRARGHRR